MDKKSKLAISIFFSLTFLSIILILFLPDKQRVEGSFFCNCTETTLNNLSSIYDSTYGFQMKIPEKWEVDRTDDDNFKGLTAIDTASLYYQNELNVISANVVSLKSSIEQQYQYDLNSLKEAQQVLESGKGCLAGKKINWIVIKNENNGFKTTELLAYYPSQRKDRFTLLNFSSSKKTDYQKILCHFKDVISSYTNTSWVSPKVDVQEK